MERSTEAMAITPSALARARWALRSLPSRAREWLLQRMLRTVIRMHSRSNLMAHAKRELAQGLSAPADSPDRWMAEDLLQLLAVFASQGHSGFSAPWCVSSFEKLARFEPLGPLTGEPDEWIEHGDGVFQNKRCSHVFKQAGRFNGQAYDIEGRIFRDPSGACYTSRDSMVPITFPYTPKREYVDVPASQEG